MTSMTRLEVSRMAPAQMMSPEESAIAEKKLKRKLDIRLLLCGWIIFVRNHLDPAKVAGIGESLGINNINSTQYATAVALFPPPPVSLYTCRNGCVRALSALVGAVQHAAGLYALRFLFGFVQAAFYPGALFLISSWYKRSEMGHRGLSNSNNALIAFFVLPS
ncbi:hypothetical protein BJX70DRAFT_393802 [Aspergillus crustosus]